MHFFMGMVSSHGTSVSTSMLSCVGPLWYSASCGHARAHLSFLDAQISKLYFPAFVTCTCMTAPSISSAAPYPLPVWPTPFTNTITSVANHCQKSGKMQSNKPLLIAVTCRLYIKPPPGESSSRHQFLNRYPALPSCSISKFLVDPLMDDVQASDPAIRVVEIFGTEYTQKVFM